jgi:hypothetical protein
MHTCERTRLTMLRQEEAMCILEEQERPAADQGRYSRAFVPPLRQSILYIATDDVSMHNENWWSSKALSSFPTDH